MIGLTRRQQDVLRFVVGFQEAKGISPSFREIGAATGLKSVSQVAGLLDKLEERGAIRRLFMRTRAIEVLRPIPLPRTPDGEPLHFISFEGED